MSKQQCEEIETFEDTDVAPAPKKETRFVVGDTVTWFRRTEGGIVTNDLVHGKITSINKEFQVYLVTRDNCDGTFTPNKAVDFKWARCT
jgi:hypothetical protein